MRVSDLDVKRGQPIYLANGDIELRFLKQAGGKITVKSNTRRHFFVPAQSNQRSAYDAAQRRTSPKRISAMLRTSENRRTISRYHSYNPVTMWDSAQKLSNHLA